VKDAEGFAVGGTVFGLAGHLTKAGNVGIAVGKARIGLAPYSFVFPVLIF
jgi:hypothetical protein